MIRGILMALDDIERELENYQKSANDQRKKTTRINWVLFFVLIFVIILFLYSLWRYQVLNN